MLDSILSLDLKKRRKLLTHWRYRTEDRRSQMLSLLAANVFRPWMEGEEPTGDDMKAVKAKLDDKIDIQHPKSFSVRKGISWFLDLCIGFYLPQIMACNFPDNPEKDKKEDVKDSSSDSITGVGWNFRSGPLHAIREFIFNKDEFFSGMMTFHCKAINKMIEKIGPGKDDSMTYFYLYLWHARGQVGTCHCTGSSTGSMGPADRVPGRHAHARVAGYLGVGTPPAGGGE